MMRWIIPLVVAAFVWSATVVLSMDRNERHTRAVQRARAERKRPPQCTTECITYRLLEACKLGQQTEYSRGCTLLSRHIYRHTRKKQ